MSDKSSNINELDQPIALRHAKRRSDAISPSKPAAAGDSTGRAFNNDVPLTPSKGRSKKRVRCSNPESTVTSSGLTPFVRRTTLNTPRRRATTPAITRTDPLEIQFTPLRQVLDDRTRRRIRRNGMSEEMNDYNSERKDKVQLEMELHAKDQELLKVKEELETAKRTLGTEKHLTVEELSSSQRTVEAELEGLRQSLHEADIPHRFDDDTDINWDAVHLQAPGATRGPTSDGGDTIPIFEDDADMLEPSTPGVRDPNATTAGLVDTVADEELLAMALDLETAKQEKRQLFKDFRAHVPASQLFPSKSTNSDSILHFDDSPVPSTRDQEDHPDFTVSTTSLPSPPKTFYADLSKALKSTTNRAETAEVALHGLEMDLRTLGFSPSPDSSTTSILGNIRAHFRQARLDLERVLPGETATGLNNPSKVLPEPISKLKLLSQRVQEREAELRSMHEQQRTLRGNFECGLRAAEKANQRIKELEDAVEEGADDLLNMRMKLQATERDGAEKDHTITSLITALEKYRADVGRLEGLVVQLEAEQSFKVQEGRDESAEKMEELEAKAAAESTGRRKAEESAVSRLEKITALQSALDAATADASALQIQLSTLEAQKADSELALRNQHSQARHDQEEQHETHVQNLNTRLATLSTALATSQLESARLDTRVGKLQSRLRISDEVSTSAVEALWQEYVRAVTKGSEIHKSYVRGRKVRGANWDMEDEDSDRADHDHPGEPMTPVSLVRFVDVEDRADASPNGEDEVEGRVEIARGRASRRAIRYRGLGIEMSSAGRRRRRWLDSGIGMGCLSEEEEKDDEAETDTEILSSDAVMPSSDSGFDIHEDPSDVALPSSESGMQE